MDTNRKLNETISYKKCQLEKFERLTSLNGGLVGIFLADYDEKSPNLISDLQNIAHSLVDTYHNLHDDLMKIENLCYLFLNDLIDRDKFIESLINPQSNLVNFIQREKLLISINTKVSSWTIKELEALDTLLYTLNHS